MKRLAPLLCLPLLTACPGWTPPSPNPGTTFTFTLPSPVYDANARVAAVAYLYEQGQPKPTIKSVGYGSIEPGGSRASLSVGGYELDALAKNPQCFGPFKGGQDTQDLDPATLSVTPATAGTCQVFFLLYSDANGDGLPQEEEVIYDTHDQFVYADQDFTYSGQDLTHSATETGRRTSGWSLVRHTVIQPSATPGQYQVTMNSEQPPATDTPYANTVYSVRLHEKTNFFTSMSVGGRK